MLGELVLLALQFLLLLFEFLLVLVQLILLLFEQHLLHTLRLRELIQFLRDATELRAGGPVRLPFFGLASAGGFDLSAGPIVQAARIRARRSNRRERGDPDCCSCSRLLHAGRHLIGLRLGGAPRRFSLAADLAAIYQQ